LGRRDAEDSQSEMEGHQLLYPRYGAHPKVVRIAISNPHCDRLGFCESFVSECDSRATPEPWMKHQPGYGASAIFTAAWLSWIKPITDGLRSCCVAIEVLRLHVFISMFDLLVNFSRTKFVTCHWIHAV